ncbi:MAG: metal ABC transporter permease [Tyzzerella sp.]|uniref:Metal ABC transporter permease n=1 Tax=Candidatus Fimicola merdigallinarum TaxID=2840819 RepID=A0A9D9DY66_9FIRM|nr:metal ABC transporter permease [Candidatus Fimicola merdigallinarum]
MEFIYKIFEILLPFDFITYDFMKNALLGTIIVSPLFAFLGTMAVNNKMAFFSDALGHSAFTGIALGVLLGLKNPLISMLVFGIFLSLIITKVKSINTASTDTIISVFSSLSMAIGIVILSKNGGFSKYSSYLIGDILTVTPREILIIFVVLIFTIAIWYKIYNKLLIISINTSLASSRSIKTVLIENIFVILVAIAVMLSIKWIGILTINSMLILPSASARNISRNSRSYLLTTIVISLISGILGLILSYYMDTSASATMVLISSIFFFLTLAIRKIRA